MNELIATAVDYLTAPGPPNWLFLLALITAPATWSDAIRKRLRPLLDQLLPLPKK